MSSMKPMSVARDLMGRVVEVRATYRRGYTGPRWVSSPAPRVRVGWVVGVTYLASSVTVDYDPDYGATPQVSGPRIQALLVRFWPNQKTVKVPMDSWSLVADGREPTWDSANPLDNAIRKMMSNEAKAMDRDAQGRFVKHELATITEASAKSTTDLVEHLRELGPK